MEERIKMTQNPERALNILQEVELMLKDANNKSPDVFVTLIIEAYYEIIKELLSALLAVDWWKTLSHTALIGCLQKEYSHQFVGYEIQTTGELRKIKNRIAYECFVVKKEYYDRKSSPALETISKLKKLITGKASK